jgi:hypothetical protein
MAEELTYAEEPAEAEGEMGREPEGAVGPVGPEGVELGRQAARRASSTKATRSMGSR